MGPPNLEISTGACFILCVSNNNSFRTDNNNNNNNNKSKLTVECQVRARIPTLTKGEFFLYLYKNNKDNKEHLAIVYGNDIRSKSLDRPRPGEKEIDRMIRGAYTGRLRPEQIKSDEFSESINGNSNKDISAMEQFSEKPPLVRIHSECFTGETLHSARCDCGEQLEEAMRLIQSEGRGVIIYLRQEGRGIGLADKLRAYNLQDLGHDTVTANLLLQHSPDLRNYDVADRILNDLNLTSIRLLTNNPDKIEQINKSGIKVVERIPMVPKLWKENTNTNNNNNNNNYNNNGDGVGSINNINCNYNSININSNNNHEELNRYLKVKVEKMRHLLDIPEIFLK